MIMDNIMEKMFPNELICKECEKECKHYPKNCSGDRLPCRRIKR